MTATWDVLIRCKAGRHEFKVLPPDGTFPFNVDGHAVVPVPQECSICDPPGKLKPIRLSRREFRRFKKMLREGPQWLTS